MVCIESQARQACCCVDLLLAQGLHLVCSQIEDLHDECSQSASAPSYLDAAKCNPLCILPLCPPPPSHHAACNLNAASRVSALLRLYACPCLPSGQNSV